MLGIVRVRVRGVVLVFCCFIDVFRVIVRVLVFVCFCLCLVLLLLSFVFEFLF